MTKFQTQYTRVGCISKCQDKTKSSDPALPFQRFSCAWFVLYSLCVQKWYLRYWKNKSSIRFRSSDYSIFSYFYSNLNYWKFINPQRHGGGSCRPPPLWFFALYSKNLQATHIWTFLTFPNFLLRMPLWNKKKSFTPAQSTFGTPSTKIFFFLL